MMSLKINGYFKLDKKIIKKIKKDFLAFKTTNQETKKTIKEIYNKCQLFVDPHTATGFNSATKFKNSFPKVILGTAHPYKFLETMKLATGKILKKPSQLNQISRSKEKFDILNNNTNLIKKYILDKQYEN